MVAECWILPTTALQAALPPPRCLLNKVRLLQGCRSPPGHISWPAGPSKLQADFSPRDLATLMPMSWKTAMKHWHTWTQAAAERQCKWPPAVPVKDCRPLENLLLRLCFEPQHILPGPASTTQGKTSQRISAAVAASHLGWKYLPDPTLSTLRSQRLERPLNGRSTGRSQSACSRQLTISPLLAAPECQQAAHLQKYHWWS
mmetsp:Transcript_19498/g.43068  ORF Transcript_19498/g.43068 Transcript_19498/m.43068 type:complete len:201 (+) Transcript_19498:571-1173(+)